MTERFQQMLEWLHTVPVLQDQSFSHPVPASSDASFRRYFRIETDLPEHKSSLIIMDAPPEYEDCLPFIRVAGQMQSYGLNVPIVMEKNLASGFLLLSDLGNRTYLSELDEHNVENLYRDAFSSLTELQLKGREDALNLPAYDEALLTREMNLFSDWLLLEHLQLSMNRLEMLHWHEVQQLLIQSALSQPQVYVHRDFHSRNLMITEQGNPGVLDFQDAVRGPLTYDAVSMVRDCYIVWPPEQVREWQREYFLMLVKQQLLTIKDWEGFVRAMDLMGIQRHLKASGIFARLFHRDGKDGYLNDIPATVQYIVEVGQQYSELAEFVNWIEFQVLPKLMHADKSKVI